MPILGEAAVKVSKFFSRDKDKKPDSKFIDLPEKDLKKYREWITLANEKHKNDVEKNAEKFIDRLKQKFPDVTDDEIQSKFNYYKVNLARIIPSLTPKEIKLKIKPFDGQDQISLGSGEVFDNRKACKILQTKIDKILKDKTFKYTMKAGIQDLYITNLGVIVVGHSMDIKLNKEVPEDMNNLMDKKAEDGTTIPGEVAEKADEVKSIDEMPKLVIKRESWRNVKVDPRANEYFFANRRFTVRIIRKELEKAKELYGDIEYTEVDRDASVTGSKLSEAKMAVLYEIYDYTKDGEVTRLTFLGEGNKCVGQTILKYDPVAVAKLSYLTDETYPPCDMAYYEDQVDEANFYRTTKMNQISRGAARKVLTATDSIDAENEEKLNSEKDLELVNVKLKAGQILDGVTKVVSSAHISPDISNTQDSIAQDIQELSAVNATRLGQVPNAPATNAMLASNAYESISAERMGIIKDWIIQIIERVIAVLIEISTEEEDLYIEHPDGTTETIKWSNKDIRFVKPIIDVDLVADEPVDQKLKRMLDWVNWITQPQISASLAANGKKFQMYEFVKEISSYFIPNANLDKFIIDSSGIPDPDRENLLMLAGQPVPPHNQEDFKKHLQSHQEFLMHPIMQDKPAIADMVQEHILATEAIMNQKEALEKVAAPPGEKPVGRPAVTVKQEAPRKQEASAVNPLLAAAQAGKVGE